MQTQNSLQFVQSTCDSINNLISDINSNNNSSDSHFSYTSGSIAKNNMLDIAGNCDSLMSSLMSSITNDVASLLKISQNFEKLNQEISDKANDLNE